jgi:hypothetical protein
MLAYRRKTAGSDNYTSYLASQHDWDESRGRRPAILFEYKKPDDYLTRYHQSAGILYTDAIDPSCGKHWRIIDDLTGQELRDLPTLPINICSDVEGWLVEAWTRLDPRIRTTDILHRMTAVQHVGNKPAVQDKKALGERRRKFRDMARCLSWSPNTPRADSGFDSRLAEEMEANPAWLQQNTTRHLQDYNLTQLMAIRKEIRDSKKHASRGGDRAGSAGTKHGTKVRKRDRQEAEIDPEVERQAEAVEEDGEEDDEEEEE